MLRAPSNMKDSEPVLFKSTDTIFQYLKRHSDSVSMNIKKFGVQYLMSKGGRCLFREHTYHWSESVQRYGTLFKML